MMNRDKSRIIFPYGLGAKIALIPALAVFALLFIKGMDRHLEGRFASADHIRERGAAISLNLTKQLLLENHYLFSADKKVLAAIETESMRTGDQVRLALLEKTNPAIHNRLLEVKSALAQDRNVFPEVADAVRAIHAIMARLTLLLNQSDLQAKNEIDTIDRDTIRLMMNSGFTNRARREFRNSLVEFMGFTSSSILNVNTLLASSDAEQFLEAEKKLAEKTGKVARACEDLSLLTGIPEDRAAWLEISRKQVEINTQKEELFQWWKLRLRLTKKLESTNYTVQDAARHLTIAAGNEMKRIRQIRHWVGGFTIIFTLAILAVLSLLAIRSITRPLTRVTEAMQDFSKGKLPDLALLPGGSRDEIGILEESFTRMVENTREIVEQAGSLAAGDYTVRIKPRSADDELSHSLISMTSSLSSLKDELENYSSQLEDIVLERTRELHETVYELEKSEQKYRGLFESSMDGLVIIDLNGIILDANQAFLEILDYDLEELQGLSCKDLTPPGWHDKDEAIFNTQVLGRGFSDVYRKEYLRKDKTAVPVSVRTWVLKDSKDFPVAVLASARDITGIIRAEHERERLEGQLRQSQKMEAIGTLAGGIAHDFNNILGIIIGFTDMARQDIPADIPAQEKLAKVLKAADRAKELVKQVLAFSRQSDQELVTLQPHLIIKEAFKLLRASIPATIEIRQNIDSRCGCISADPTQIHQIIMNLCSNAVHAMHEKGILEIRLDKTELAAEDLGHRPDMEPGPYVRLSVTDTGDGMDDQVLARIFDPFFTTKEIGMGTGMGLSMIHGIVTDYNGMITVESIPGRGTTFEIFFPVIADRPKPAAEQRTQPLPSGDERILFVDDEIAMAELGGQMLTKVGYKVMIQSDSRAALAEFSTRPQDFDLVITDQTMPNLSGDELTRKLLAVRPDIPIILCTGFSSIITEEEAIELGVRKFAMKPLDKKELTLLVRQVLDENLNRADNKASPGPPPDIRTEVEASRQDSLPSAGGGCAAELIPRGGRA